jgi:ABC-2 type transport system permease protein
MSSQWIAWRIFKEITRDRRTVAFLLLVPFVVMTLIYFAVAEDETVEVGVVTRGVARLFDVDMIDAIESEDNVDIVSLDIPDEEIDNTVLERLIIQELKQHHADVILYMDQQLLTDRFDGKRGTLHVYIEGTHPTLTATALSAIASAMDDLASSMPTVIDSSCSALCANSVNSLPMDLEEHYLYGSEDYRMIDYFLPVFPPFFVFFFTFILSTISFQRERVNGTLERLMVAPVGFTQIIVGYVGGFFLFAAMQATIILSYVLYLVSFSFTLSQVLSIALITTLMMLIGLMLGLLASFVANNEFQAIQFIPLVILPQIFLSDMIWDIESFPWFFQLLSIPLPLTHANSAMRDILLKNMSLLESWPEIATLVGFILIILLSLLAVGRTKNL